MRIYCHNIAVWTYSNKLLVKGQKVDSTVFYVLCYCGEVVVLKDKMNCVF